MVNKDIVGGLKSALSRGYSLDEAILSFSNAGYKRNEIEEAAKSVQDLVSTQPSLALKPEPILENSGEKSEIPSSESLISKPKPKEAPAKQIQIPVPAAPVRVSQVAEKPLIKEKIAPPLSSLSVTQNGSGKVSAYPDFNKRIKTITAVLVSLLIVLIGILGLMYTFKSQIISFFNAIFSNV